MGGDRFHIDVLRHGEVDGGPRYRGVTDDLLTPHGWTQMWDATDGVRWDCVVTSPAIRCADFARALAERRALPLRVDERLHEMNFGAWEGRTAAELIETEPAALVRFWQDPWNNTPPQAESLINLQKRVLAAWYDIMALHQSALLVTHGGPIRVLLQHLHQHPLEMILSLNVSYGSLHRLHASVAKTIASGSLS